MKLIFFFLFCLNFLIFTQQDLCDIKKCHILCMEQINQYVLSKCEYRYNFCRCYGILYGKHVFFNYRDDEDPFKLNKN